MNKIYVIKIQKVQKNISIPPNAGLLQLGSPFVSQPLPSVCIKEKGWEECEFVCVCMKYVYCFTLYLFNIMVYFGNHPMLVDNELTLFLMAACH